MKSLARSQQCGYWRFWMPKDTRRQCAGLLEPLAAGDPIAASLLTLDIVSFQAKGRWLGRRRLLGAPVGTMAVTAVYAGGPPIPGRQVA